MTSADIITGDALTVLRGMEAGSVDSIVHLGGYAVTMTVGERVNVRTKITAKAEGWPPMDWQVVDAIISASDPGMSRTIEELARVYVAAIDERRYHQGMRAYDAESW